MKIDKELIEQLEKADAFFIIAVKDGGNMTSVQGKYSDDLETVHHIVQGMLGLVNQAINKKVSNNSLPLMVLIKQAVRMFPDFKNNR